MLQRVVTGSTQDGQTHPQVPSAAHGTGDALQATVTT